MVKIKNTMSNWGGAWTQKKLDAFEKYVKAYLVIMKRYKEKNNWQTIYFDGFAGSGEGFNIGEQNSLFPEFFNEDMNVYRSAAELVLSLKYGFDYHYFIDKDKESLLRLQEKLTRIADANGKKASFRLSDANEQLKLLSLAFLQNPNKYAALIFLDPFAMEIKWESILNLKSTRSDLWILIPSGVIINRLLDRHGHLKYISKLESFFGLSEEEIQGTFYKLNRQNDLFGEEIQSVEKIPNAINEIAALYVKQLKTVWRFVTEKPLILTNSHNVPIFHFIFASNNKTALNIANDIII